MDPNFTLTGMRNAGIYYVTKNSFAHIWYLSHFYRQTLFRATLFRAKHLRDLNFPPSMYVVQCDTFPQCVTFLWSHGNVTIGKATSGKTARCNTISFECPMQNFWEKCRILDCNRTGLYDTDVNAVIIGFTRSKYHIH